MANQMKWSIDKIHSEISFTVKHLMMLPVKGLFKTFDASIYSSDKVFTNAEVKIWIEVSSISTDDTNCDTHLKSIDFFDVARYKQITFTSNLIEKSGSADNYVLSGDLTIKGITKNLNLIVQAEGPSTDSAGIEKNIFTITGKFNRTDWGLTWNKPMITGGLLVGEEVYIACKVELIHSVQESAVMESI